ETDDDSTIIDIIDAGADDFLKKPVSLGLLKAKLKSMQRLMAMRQNLIDYGQQLRTVNDNLLSSTQLLNELSLKDPLTLIGNRRAFQEIFDKALRSAIRNGEPLSMVMIDIDYFKLYNDTLGHQTGDFCLKEVAQLFANAMHRPKDFIARFGGEEFAVLLPETDLKGACQVADRLRIILEDKKIEHPASTFRYVTASFGVACTIPFRGFRSEDLLRIADLALYQAKQEGRNCVVHCAETVESLKFHAEPPLQKYA
ncbi:MAG TPA: GGDEF domain-containing protein, partial [Gammaproteobacteria bacterium]|nr:GGDEF domain-containing protein [Gammaproteobacteria bacterium]